MNDEQPAGVYEAGYWSDDLWTPVGRLIHAGYGCPDCGALHASMVQGRHYRGCSEPTPRPVYRIAPLSGEPW